MPIRPTCLHSETQPRFGGRPREKPGTEPRDLRGMAHLGPVVLEAEARCPEDGLDFEGDHHAERADGLGFGAGRGPRGVRLRPAE